MGKAGLVSLTALAAFAAGASAFAADLPKEGTYDITACATATSKGIPFSKTHSAQVIEQSGIALSNPPGGLLDKGAFYCVGMATSFDAAKSFETVCEVTLPDGEKILSKFSLGPDGKTIRQFVAGTGKYEGIAGQGVVDTIVMLPLARNGTVQFCNRQTGTYRLR